MGRIQVYIAVLCIAWVGGSIGCYAWADEVAFPGDKQVWNGYDRYDFTYDTRTCIVVVPKSPAEHRPWIWRARFFGHEPQADLALLERGFHLV